MSTVRVLLREGACTLSGPLGGGAAQAARWLLMKAAGWRPQELLLHLDESLDKAALGRYLDLTDRCLAGEPVQYVLGRWDFCGLELAVDRRALIPRPETELLAEAAVVKLSPGGRAADVGCGGGCVGLVLAARRPGACVTLMDVSQDALALAGENARALGLDVTILKADMGKKLPGGPYDLLVCNPPYIADGQVADLDPAVTGFEPMLALAGGPDGLDCYRALAARAADSLAPGGWLLLELGVGQREAVSALLAPVCDDMTCTADAQGIPRVLAARRRMD